MEADLGFLLLSNPGSKLTTLISSGTYLKLYRKVASINI